MHINFMKYRYFYFVFSLCFLVPGIFFLLKFGLRPSIDFTGGSVLEVKIVKNDKHVDLTQPKLQEIVGKEYQILSLQKPASDEVILRGKPITEQQKIILIGKMNSAFGAVQEQQFQTIGPILGAELLSKTINAGIIVGIFIIGYIWWQFHNLKYGVAAVVAMFHDAFIVIGAFSILGKLYGVEVDVLFVTALLTILSFSVHDTIIVFDRIRETVRKHPNVPFIDIVNAAVLQTLGRSINNSLTIILMLSALVLLGGSTIRWFAVALLIGAITGTYSSTFTAAPLLLVWDEVEKWWKGWRRKKQRV